MRNCLPKVVFTADYITVSFHRRKVDYERI